MTCASLNRHTATCRMGFGATPVFEKVAVLSTCPDPRFKKARVKGFPSPLNRLIYRLFVV